MVIIKSIANKKVSELLNKGDIGIIPTDTLYGLVCRASNKESVKKLYEIKDRDNKPGTIIAASIDQLVELGVARRYLKAVEQFWPNPISVVLPVPSSLSYISISLPSLPMRVVDDKLLNKLLIKTGPLLTSSANPPEHPPANSLEEAINYFKEKIGFYVDGGDLSGKKPSTIIRVIDDAIEVLRVGAVNIDENGLISNQ